MVLVRLKLSQGHDVIGVNLSPDSQWSDFKVTFGSTFGIDSNLDLYCVLLDSNGNVASSTINETKKFWTIYNSKYCLNENYIFEINIRKPAHQPSVSSIVPTIASRNQPSDLSQLSIHKSCQDGNLEVVQELVRQGSHINARDATSSSPLHYAAMFGHLNIVKYLINEKAFKNNKNSTGQTPLLCAAMNGHLEVVQYLIEEKVFGFAVDNEGNSALHAAAKNGHHLLLKWMIQSGVVDASIKNLKGQTYHDLLLIQQRGSSPVATASAAPTDPVLTYLPCQIEGSNQSVDIALSIPTLTWEELCVSVLRTFEILPSPSPSQVLEERGYSSSDHLLIEHAVLLEEDGDEGSGKMNDLRKFTKVFNKLYKQDTGMVFSFTLNKSRLALINPTPARPLTTHQENRSKQGLSPSLL
jgi:hypothetical protein